MRVLKLSTVDLILVDVFMPEADGIEVIQTVRRKNPTVGIIAMSGGAAGGNADDMLVQCTRLGACAILAKPFAAEQLTTAIAGALGARRRSR